MISPYYKNSKTQSLPSEIVVGYSGAPIAIKIEKQPLNVYIQANQYSSTYDLDSKILSLLNNNTDMSFYSGINIYLPENSVFRSDNNSKVTPLTTHSFRVSAVSANKKDPPL